MSVLKIASIIMDETEYMVSYDLDKNNRARCYEVTAENGFTLYVDTCIPDGVTENDIIMLAGFAIERYTEDGSWVNS